MDYLVLVQPEVLLDPFWLPWLGRLLPHRLLYHWRCSPPSFRATIGGQAFLRRALDRVRPRSQAFLGFEGRHKAVKQELELGAGQVWTCPDSCNIRDVFFYALTEANVPASRLVVGKRWDLRSAASGCRCSPSLQLTSSICRASSRSSRRNSWMPARRWAGGCLVGLCGDIASKPFGEGFCHPVLVSGCPECLGSGETPFGSPETHERVAGGARAFSEIGLRAGTSAFLLGHAHARAVSRPPLPCQRQLSCAPWMRSEQVGAWRKALA